MQDAQHQEISRLKSTHDRDLERLKANHEKEIEKLKEQRSSQSNSEVVNENRKTAE